MAVSTKGLTAADLLELFGPMPAGRIRTDPPPGTATEQDVIDIEARESRLCELVDGVLVEKTVGYYESYLAGTRLIVLIGAFVEQHRLGVRRRRGWHDAPVRQAWCAFPTFRLFHGTNCPDAVFRA